MGRLITAVPDRYLAALGRVTVAFQALEFHLGKILWLLLSSDRSVGQVVTAQLRFQSLLDVLGTLHAHHVQDPRQRTKMDRLLKRASSAEVERNRLVHSLWIGGTDRRFRPYRQKVTAKRKAGLKFDPEHVSLTKIRALANNLETIAYDAIDVEIAVAKTLSRW